jgi:hypothetical protein
MPFIRADLGLNKRREEPRVPPLRRPGLLTLRGRPKAEKRKGEDTQEGSEYQKEWSING